MREFGHTPFSISRPDWVGVMGEEKLTVKSNSEHGQFANGLRVRVIIIIFFCLLLCIYLFIFSAALAAYRGSQARGRIGATAASLPMVTARRIQATSAIYTTAHGNAGSLTH